MTHGPAIRLICALVAALLVSASLVVAQGTPKYAAPRTPWGDPDLQGKWPGTDLVGVPLPYFGIVPFAFWVVFIAFQLSRESARTAERETQAQQRLRAIFDHTLHFMGLLDVNGVVLEANRPVLEAVGLSPEAVLGKPVWQTPLWSHSDELREGVRRAAQAAAAGKTIRFETWHPLADGSIGYVDFSVTPIKDEDGKVVLLVPEGRDITARKKTQQALDRLVDVVAPRTGQ